MNKISIVCPTFNSSHFIEKTLTTIIKQTLKPYEIIISDDGSEDNTLIIINNFIRKNGKNLSWHVLKNKHKGPGSARNLGIYKAKGEWIAFIDSDDLWEDNKLEEVEQAIKKFPRHNLFCHDELLVTVNGKIKRLSHGKRYTEEKPLTKQIYFANIFSTSAVVCKRDLLVKSGCFNETLMSGQDYELWLRMSPRIYPFFLHKVLGKYVQRKDNISSNNLISRMKNEFKIAILHRKKVTVFGMTLKFIRIILSFLKQFLIYKFNF